MLVTGPLRRCRRDLANDVDRVLRQAPHDYQLKGSFRHGDFHLIAPNTTFSDLDLVLPNVGEDARHDHEQEVRSALAARGWHLRVSVQASDSTAGLDLDESRLLTVAEFVRFHDLHRRSASSWAYLIGKVTLGVLRQRPQERTTETAARIGSDHALAANRARLGHDPSFTNADALRLLDGHGASIPVATTLGTAIETGSIEQARSRVLGDIGAMTAVPWLRERMIELLSDA